MLHTQRYVAGAMLVLFLAVGSPAHAARECPTTLDSLVSSMNCVTLNAFDGTVWATDNRHGPQTLVRIEFGGIQVVPVHRFSNPIMGIHCTGDGTMFVSTDFNHQSADYPCSLFRSTDGARSFVFVKEFPASAALAFSMAHDRDDHLYVGEYGPYAPGQSKSVWKSTDHGDTWEVVFRAPDLNGVHIHKVAVDPYTNDVWVTHGDSEQGIYRSRDGGRSWSFVRSSKATAAAFTREAIYWGEDDSLGVVTRYDRASERSNPVLEISKLGPYGGSVFDMTIGPSGLIYVPFKRYLEQSHLPTLWVGRDDDWRLLTVLDQPRTGASHITPPDRQGYMYFMYHRLREPCPDRPPPLRFHLSVSPRPMVGMRPLIRFTLPVEAAATLECFDIAGRRALSRDVGSLGPGTHTVDLTEGLLRPGLYVIRLTQGDAVGTSRMIVTR